jgi:hypothetical protein
VTKIKRNPCLSWEMFKIESNQTRAICFLKFGNTVKLVNCLNNTTHLSWYIDVTKSKSKKKSSPSARHGGAWGGGEEVYSSYSFTTSALDGVEWSASRPVRALLPGKGPPVPILQEAGWAPEPVWTQRLEEKFSAPAGDRTPIVQPVVRHYTASANPAYLMSPKLMNSVWVAFYSGHPVQLCGLIHSCSDVFILGLVENYPKPTCFVYKTTF